MENTLKERLKDRNKYWVYLQEFYQFLHILYYKHLKMTSYMKTILFYCFVSF